MKRKRKHYKVKTWQFYNIEYKTVYFHGKDIASNKPYIGNMVMEELADMSNGMIKRIYKRWLNAK